MKKYRALFFDNDGILVDTEHLYYKATKEVLAEVGVELTHALYHEYFLVSSQGTLPLLQQKGLGEEAAAAVREKRNARYLALLRDEPLAIPGARETLRALRPHYAIGIVTSSYRNHFDAIHERTGMLEFVDFVLAQGDYPDSKPAPDPYLAAIAKSGVPATECLAIEDSLRGLAAARSAGIDCWVVPHALTRFADFSSATRILSGISEVASALLPAAT